MSKSTGGQNKLLHQNSQNAYGYYYLVNIVFSWISEFKSNAIHVITWLIVSLAILRLFIHDTASYLHTNWIGLIATKKNSISFHNFNQIFELFPTNNAISFIALPFNYHAVYCLFLCEFKKTNNNKWHPL